MCLYKSYTLPIITKCMSPTSVHVQAHPNTHILSHPHTQMPPGTPFTTLDILRPLPTYKLTRMRTQTHTHICTHTLTLTGTTYTTTCSRHTIHNHKQGLRSHTMTHKQACMCAPTQDAFSHTPLSLHNRAPPPTPWPPPPNRPGYQAPSLAFQFLRGSQAGWLSPQRKIYRYTNFCIQVGRLTFFLKPTQGLQLKSPNVGVPGSPVSVLTG